jgi:hypothetical protein
MTGVDLLDIIAIFATTAVLLVVASVIVGIYEQGI